MTSRFKQLSEFIRNQMRMSHIYQPVMLIELLQNSGSSTVTEIAKSLLAHDRSQIEYYEQITKNMVGRVLTRSRGITEKERNTYHLKGFDELKPDEVSELINLCGEKIDEYVSKRGDAIWSHRKKSSAPISGTIRYEVLKRAKFRCELCGISADEKALEVDHIIPRNHNGNDDLSNLQALCYSCNAMKRDRDDTDFRGVADKYEHRKEGCIFCKPKKHEIVGKNELAWAVTDSYPVSEHHTLIIPKRHVAAYFDLYHPEKNAIQFLLDEQQKLIREKDSSVTGFNIGVNVGKDAGQTVFHVHVHLIPRRKEDTQSPKGGVRGVIPEKQQY